MVRNSRSRRERTRRSNHRPSRKSSNQLTGPTLWPTRRPTRRPARQPTRRSTRRRAMDPAPMTHPISMCLKASRRCGDGRACISAQPARRACITSCMRSSTTPSDEAMAGQATRIEIALQSGGWVQVRDDGRGIPVDTHSKTGKSALETVLTVLHAGGKFGGGGYKVSGGLHGVGASVVNALSSQLEVEVRRDSTSYTQSYVRGVPNDELERAPLAPEATPRTGTMVRWIADDQVIDQLEYDFHTLAQRFREIAYLNKSLWICFRDERHFPTDATDEERGPARADGTRRTSTSRVASSPTCASSTATARSCNRCPSISTARSPAMARRSPSRSRSNTTPTSRTRSTPSPTRSTRTRVART